MTQSDWPRSRNSFTAIWVLLLPALLNGCSSIEVALGLRTRLDKLPVTAIAARLSPDPNLAPGKSGKLVITVTTTDGRELVTEGAGHGTVLFDSFTFAPRVVLIDRKGDVSLPPDPRLSDTVTPQLGIGVVGHPDVTAQLDIPVRYDVAFEADFSGQPGTSGFDGRNGWDGRSGADGSVDMNNNPSAGGNGTDGENGTDGDDGRPGEAGQAVRVLMTMMPGRSLIEVKATAKTGDQYFLMDPKGGSLTLKANGGPGGRGGSGGKGGRGGAGGNGFPPGMAGSDGRNGADGHAGPDGAAGSFDVTVDPKVQVYVSQLHFSNSSGGRSGAPPAIRFEPVAPLW